ncbi:MAG: hypothetical protein J0H80_22265 [Rhizobiales bacterium]|nr:hypothetical protein [Hyphomicrobiales bacterium]
MSGPAISSAQARMNAIRLRVEGASPDWCMIDNGRLGMTAGQGPEQFAVLTFDPKADIGDQEIIAHARDDLSWLLAAYDRLARHYREAVAEKERAEQARKGKDFAAECAMLCGQQPFRIFLQERHGLDAADRERIDTRVRSILAIQSRAELNKDEDARQRWFSLRAQFRQWKEGRR